MKMPGVRHWNDAARAEQDFLDFEEPYRSAPDRQALSSACASRTRFGVVITADGPEPAVNGLPATAVSAPLLASMANALTLLLPALAT